MAICIVFMTNSIPRMIVWIDSIFLLISNIGSTLLLILILFIFRNKVRFLFFFSFLDYTKPLLDYYTESNTNGNNSEEEGDASQKDNKTAEGEEFKKEFTEKEKEIILRKRQIREYKRLYREPLYVRNNIISKGVDWYVVFMSF